MKLRIFLSAAIILILGLLAVELNLSGRESKETPKDVGVTSSGTSVSKNLTPVKPPALAASSADLPMSKRVEIWSEQIGQIQENPQVIEDSLDEFSASLNASDVLELKKIIQRSQTQDERFLSTELLVRNRSAEAKQALKEIALSPESETEKQSPALKTEENALRLRAVEGLLKSDDPQVSKNFLEEVQRKTSNSIVQDRSQRALLSLKGIAKSPEEQDQDALRELLRR